MEGNDSDGGDKNDFFNPEEEIGITATAKVVLPEVAIKTGEEEEELIFKMRARLYRWRDEWKERGTGELKLLRHKKSKKIRCVLRQDKTLKPVANFVIAETPLCVLKEHQGSDKMFFFTAYDCSEDPYQIEKFVLKFGNSDSKISIYKLF